MNRQLLFLIACSLFLVPCAVKAQDATLKKAQEPTTKKAGHPNFNQVYVKIIMPTAPADGDKDLPIVESWVAEDLRKLGRAKCTAVTGWVPLDLSPLESTEVWDGKRKLGESHIGPAAADIERTKGPIIKVHVGGWCPSAASVIVSLRDEPGSRAIAPVKDLALKEGKPYVAVLIGPPLKKQATPAVRKK